MSLFNICKSELYSLCNKTTIFCLPFLFLFLRCSQDHAGFGSETTNGSVAVVILNQQGQPSQGTQVFLIPSEYNPVKDSADSLCLSDTTDTNGIVEFLVDSSGIFNLLAYNPDKGTKALHRYIDISKDSIFEDTLILLNPGVIKVLLPDTVDTADGYIYFKGTDIKKNISDSIIPYGGYFLIILDFVPASELTELIYTTTNPESKLEIITDTLYLNPGDTISFAATGKNIKPVWTFSLVVAVKDVVSEHFGGLNSIRPLIKKQVNTSCKKFNKHNVFDAVIHFSVDSVNEFSGSLFDEGKKDLDGFDYRLLYSDERSARGREGYDDINRFTFIYLYTSNIENFFKEWDQNLLISLLGGLRGCLKLSWLNVDSTENPVNGEEYTGVSSVMNDPTDYDVWKDYNIGIINYNADKVGSERDIIYKAFPQTMGVIVKSKAGSVVEGADIAVYGIELNSGSVNEEPCITGQTGMEGLFLFDNNLFTPDDDNDMKYGNFLIRAISDIDTAYSWFPLTGAGEAYFANPGTSLFIEVTF